MFNFSLAPPNASNFSTPHDIVFYTLLGLTLLFTGIVGILVLIFAIRYRAGSKVSRHRPVHEHLPIEITWSVIPLVLGLVVFFMGAKLFVDMRTMPKDAEEVFVVGKQWMWHIQHPNGVRENNTLHVPLNKPVRLTMISQDVIHAFYVPAFRVQYHVVPGRYTDLWFTPTKAGTYPIYCNMYCGTQHSEMVGEVYVMPQQEYAAWMSNGGDSGPRLTMEQAGAAAWARLGCNNGGCHGSTNGVRGPSLDAIYGTTRKFADGTTAVANEAYLRESILQPYNHITSGYENTMPSYEEQITEDDVLNLLAYIKSLGQTVPKAGTTKPSSDPAKGLVGGEYTKSNPTYKVGAQEAEVADDVNRGTPKPGNLAVGALAAEAKEGKR